MPVLLVLLFALALIACSSDSSDPLPPLPPLSSEIRLETVATGLVNPLHLTAPLGDERLFIVEQGGTIRIVQNGQLLPQPFLDISERVLAGGEQGLLSMAFHPQYASNGFFYVNYTERPTGHTRVERFQVSADPNVADPASALLILFVEQPFANHNGGLVTFGPDGKLYVGMGDGGDGGDPFGNGQNLGTLLAKLLRIDVDAGTPYAIPPDNPYVGRADALGEIWASGLRNPWRFSFDRQAGLLYVGDVGQDRLEEIDVVPAGQAGLNYGWDILEGSLCYPDGDSCNRDGLVLPVLEYGRSDGCSVVGGHVYRGSAVPTVVGRYFYSDFCNGWLRSFTFDGAAATDQRQYNVGSIGNVLGIGEDAAGELYVLSASGSVFRIAPAN
jgi:glucose/arabinose dehydrogenase